MPQRVRRPATWAGGRERPGEGGLNEGPTEDEGYTVPVASHLPGSGAPDRSTRREEDEDRFARRGMPGAGVGGHEIAYFGGSAMTLPVHRLEPKTCIFGGNVPGAPRRLRPGLVREGEEFGVGKQVANW